MFPSFPSFAPSAARCAAIPQGEDLAQETLARAWSARDGFEMGTNMEAWTFMILRNLFYSEKQQIAESRRAA